MVAAILLAAGASRRLGQPKQLLDFLGETLLRRTARVALEAGLEPAIVVLGFEGERMKKELQGLPAVSVLAENWSEGLGASLRAGASCLPEGATAAAVLACDQPGVDAALLRALLARHSAAPERIVAAAYAGTLGIPAILPRRLFAALRSLEGDRGARSLLRGGHEDVIAVPCARAAFDLDTPEDVEAWRVPLAFSSSR